MTACPFKVRGDGIARRRFANLLGLAVFCLVIGSEAAENPVPLPAYADSAMPAERRVQVTAELKRRLVSLDDLALEKDANADRVLATAESGDLRRTAIIKRREIRKALRSFIDAELGRGDVSGLGFAERGVADFAKALDVQDEELRYFRESPDRGGARRFCVTSFGAKGDGTADDTSAFLRAFDAIRKEGDKPTELVVPAGTYLFKGRHTAIACGERPGEDWRVKAFSGAQLPISGLANCRIVGAGPEHTRFRFCGFSDTMVTFMDCRNVALRGVEIALRDVPFLEGRLETFDIPAGGATIRLKTGSMCPDHPCWKKCGETLAHVYTNGVAVADARAFFWQKRARRLADDRWWLDFDFTKMDPWFLGYARNVRPGMDLVVAARRNGVYAVDVKYSTAVSFENVVVRNSRSAGFCSTQSRLLALCRCQVRPGEGWSLSTNADGCFMDLGTILLDCVFDSMGDDGLNIRTYAQIVDDVLPSNGIAARDRDGGTSHAGEVAVVADPLTGQYLGNLTFAATDAPVGPDGIRTSRFTTSVPDMYKGKFLYVTERYGFGSVVSGCTFRNGWLCGSVIQVPNVLLEDNRYEGLCEGVRLGALGDCREGPPPYNVILSRPTYSAVDRNFLSYVRLRSPEGRLFRSRAELIRGVVTE